MRKIFSFFLCITLASLVFSQELLPSQITGNNLRSLLNNDYRSICTLTEDDDLKITTDDFKIFVEIDAKRQLLRFHTGWKKSDMISDSRLYKIMNEWNSNKIFCTAAYYKNDGAIRLEHYVCTDGGINAENLNGTIEWVLSIAKGFEKYLTEEDAYN